MTTVAIVPEPNSSGQVAFRAIAGTQHSSGRTAGEALDALTPLLPPDETSTLVIVQHLRPDALFTAQQQQRLGELMGKWRAARDTGGVLSADEQAELEKLIEAELEAATQRAKALLQQLST